MYIQLNSQIICYEKTGEGSPVILIHGNSGDHHVFDELATTMSGEHTVYAMDSRGYGESATPKEYHYTDMAEDVKNLIEALEIDKPYIMGLADGGVVALLVAIKYSHLISGIVCCGANLTPDGFKFQYAHELKKAYKKSKDSKILMKLQEPQISVDMLQKISVPALIIAGEKDVVKEKETMKIVDNIRKAIVSFIPEADHTNYVIGTDKLYRHIRNFLK